MAITNHPSREGISPTLDSPNIVFFAREGPKPCTISLGDEFQGDSQIFPSSRSLRRVYWKFHRDPSDPALIRIVHHFREFFAESLTEEEKGIIGISVADPEDVMADYAVEHPSSPISPQVQAA